jgi:hypothetical protein
MAAAVSRRQPDLAAVRNREIPEGKPIFTGFSDGRNRPHLPAGDVIKSAPSGSGLFYRARMTTRRRVGT